MPTETETEAQGSTTEETKAETQTGSQETDWKAEARKWEARAKENGEKARQLEAKTATTAAVNQPGGEISARLAEFETRVTEAERTANETGLELTRLQVATDKGIAKDHLPLLTATSREALEVQADAILKLSSGSGRVPGQGGRDATATGGTVSSGREIFESTRNKTKS
jgi:hypothetical protein